jgi:hypothetical protein
VSNRISRQIAKKLAEIEVRELALKRERFRRGLYNNSLIAWMCSIEWTRPERGFARGFITWRGLGFATRVFINQSSGEMKWT